MLCGPRSCHAGPEHTNRMPASVQEMEDGRALDAECSVLGMEELVVFFLSTLPWHDQFPRPVTKGGHS
jgi:hypothetical protein